MGVVLRACYSSPWTWKQEAQKFKDNLGYIRSCSYFVLKRGAGGSCPENADIEFICGEPELCPHVRVCTIWCANGDIQLLRHWPFPCDGNTEYPF